MRVEIRLRSVMAITLDFESSNPSSNLGAGWPFFLAINSVRRPTLRLPKLLHFKLADLNGKHL